MNSAYHPSCFDSTIWGKLCRIRAKMRRNSKKENHNGIGKRTSLASRPYQPTTRLSLPTNCLDFFPRPPFSLGLSVGQKLDYVAGRPVFGTGMFRTSKWVGYGRPVTISSDTNMSEPVMQPLMNPAQQCFSDINRPSFMSIGMRVPVIVDPLSSEGLQSRAPGSPLESSNMLAPGTPITDRSPRAYRCHYSRKVFIGGLPPDVTALSLTASFREFGVLEVGWPRMSESASISPPKGFAFLQFQNEESVHQLVRSCYRVNSNNCVGYFTRVSSLACEKKEVQVRPWNILDSELVMDAANLNERNAVFVGGVPRPLTAYQLADVMSKTFGPVCAAAIETDNELGYPKGSARVTFRHRASKIAAISARFMQLSVDDINKRVEIKPFVLQDQPCGHCSGLCLTDKTAQYFCPNVACLEYLCQTCWAIVHADPPSFSFHKPLLQKSSNNNRRVDAVGKLNQYLQQQKLSLNARLLCAQRLSKLMRG